MNAHVRAILHTDWSAVLWWIAKHHEARVDSSDKWQLPLESSAGCLFCKVIHTEYYERLQRGRASGGTCLYVHARVSREQQE